MSERKADEQHRAMLEKRFPRMNETVCLAGAGDHFVSGGRCATIHGLTVQDFASKFGDPHNRGDDEKVTAEWYFETPRGIVSVHDYWWNAKDELSIGAAYHDSRGALWICRYLRQQGIDAHVGGYPSLGFVLQTRAQNLTS